MLLNAATLIVVASLVAGSPDHPVAPQAGNGCAWYRYHSGLRLGDVTSNDKLIAGPHGNGIAQIYAVMVPGPNHTRAFLVGFLYRPFTGDWGFEAAVDDPSPHLWFGLARQPSGISDDITGWVEEAQLDARKPEYKALKYHLSQAVAGLDTAQTNTADERPCFSSLWNGSD